MIPVVALLVSCSFLGSQEASAYPESHPPFPAGHPTPYPTLKAELVIDYDEPAKFTEGDVRIETERVSADQVTTRVSVGGRVLLDTAKDSPDMPVPAGSRVFYTDLTGDGRKDMLIYAYPGSNGLGASIEVADLLIAQPDGTYHHESFEAYAATPQDFIDVNGDDGLRLNDQLIPDFPKIIWFTEKPNDQPTQKLTPAEREDLIRQSTAKWQGQNSQ